MVDKGSNIPDVGNVSSENGDNLINSEADVEEAVNSSPKFNDTGVLRLVGPSCEVLVQLEGKSCQALLDTGSMVSTVTYSLSQQLKLAIHPMNHFIQVERVGGQLLQYMGYVIAKVQLPDMNQEVEAMFLVVPDVWLQLYNTCPHRYQHLETSAQFKCHVIQICMVFCF